MVLVRAVILSVERSTKEVKEAEERKKEEEKSHVDSIFTPHKKLAESTI